MSGYLERLAARLAGGDDARQRVLPPRGSTLAHRGHRGDGEPVTAGEAAPSKESSDTDRNAAGLERRPESDKHIGAVSYEPEKPLSPQPNRQATAGQITSVTEEPRSESTNRVNADPFVPGRAGNIDSMAQNRPRISADQDSWPRRDIGLPQKDGLYRSVALGSQPDFPSSVPQEEHGVPQLHPRMASGAATVELPAAITVEDGKTIGRRSFHSPEEPSDVQRVEAADWRPEPGEAPGTGSIFSLSPRQMVSPPGLQERPEGPKLVIGRLTVEVVRVDPPPRQPVSAPRPRPTSRQSGSPPGSETGPHTKLNFGLGQV